MKRIASPLHFLFVLVLLAIYAYRSAINSAHLTDAASVNRIMMYLRTIAFEWIMLGVVLFGVKRHGAPLDAVLGERWHSWRDVARDVGIAAVFWVLSTMLLSALATAMHGTQSATVRALLPRTPLESVLWLGVSITAGICEEAIFRGYIQRQAIAMTNSATLGILVSAIAFGAGHSYKGGGGAIAVAASGLLLSLLAYWRRSVRPGMIAHAFTDVFAGLLAGLLKIKIA